MLNWFHWFHSENMLIIINYKQEPSPAARYTCNARIHFSNLYLSKERLTERFISHSHRVHTHTLTPESLPAKTLCLIQSVPFDVSTSVTETPNMEAAVVAH